MNQNPTMMNRLNYAKYRMLTPGGFQSAGQEMWAGAQDYGQRFGRAELRPGWDNTLRQGTNVPIPSFKEGKIGLGTATVPGTKYAGTALADAAQSTKAVARVINMIPGLNLLGDIFDVGEAVVGVARKDKERQGQARQLAQQMAQSGMSLDQAMNTIESTGGELESLVGNQGASDYGKTLAYGAFTGGPSLNPIAALAGLITAGDLQWEKHRRNQIFKDEFRKAQGM